MYNKLTSLTYFVTQNYCKQVKLYTSDIVFRELVFEAHETVNQKAKATLLRIFNRFIKHYT